MVERVRGKFFVIGLECSQHDAKGAKTIKLAAVSANENEQSENTMFHQWTPSGEIKMHVNNPAAVEFFELGQEMYVDFVKAPAKKV